MEQYLGGSERPLCEVCSWLCRAGNIRSAHLGSGPGTSGKLDSGIICNTKQVNIQHQGETFVQTDAAGKTLELTIIILVNRAVQIRKNALWQANGRLCCSSKPLCCSWDKELPKLTSCQRGSCSTCCGLLLWVEWVENDLWLLLLGVTLECGVTEFQLSESRGARCVSRSGAGVTVPGELLPPSTICTHEGAQRNWQRRHKFKYQGLQIGKVQGSPLPVSRLWTASTMLSIALPCLQANSMLRFMTERQNS